VRHPIDIAIMFAALWLLGSMVLDYLTPKELTVYMIAAATAPTLIAIGLCYYLQFPMIDFTMISAAFWLVATIAVEWISPKPLPAYIIAGALVPVLIVGAVLHWRRYRSGESWRTSASYQSARRSNPGLRPLPAVPEKDDQASPRADAAS